MTRSEYSTRRKMRLRGKLKPGCLFLGLLFLVVVSGCRHLDEFLPGIKVAEDRVVSDRVVALPNGGTITVPKGALPPGAEIAVSPARMPLLPDDVTPVGEAVDIRSTVQPAEPVLLRFPVPDGVADPSNLVIIRVESDGTTTFLMTEVDGGQLMATAPGFSRFVIGLLTDKIELTLAGPRILVPGEQATYWIDLTARFTIPWDYFVNHQGGKWTARGGVSVVYESSNAAMVRAHAGHETGLLTYELLELTKGRQWYGSRVIRIMKDDESFSFSDDRPFKVTVNTLTPYIFSGEEARFTATVHGDFKPPIIWTWSYPGESEKQRVTDMHTNSLELPPKRFYSLDSTRNYVFDISARDHSGKLASSRGRILVINKPRPLQVALEGPERLQWDDRPATGEYEAIVTGGKPPYTYWWDTMPAGDRFEQRRIPESTTRHGRRFNEPGLHLVKVTAFDVEGKMAEAVMPVRIAGEPLSARNLMQATAQSGEEIEAIIQIRGGVMVVSGKKQGYRLHIDWGDGNTTEIKNIGYDPVNNINRTPFQGTATSISHSYQNADEYTVKIQAFDSTGTMATDTQIIKVADVHATGLAIDTQGPVVTIESHRTSPPWSRVSEGTIILAGTATDRGRGGSGIHAVYINDSLADTGGTAADDGVASWSETLHLNPGWNEITVTAYDDSPDYNNTVEVLRIYYDAPDAPLQDDDIPPPPLPVLTAELDCGDSFELAPGDFVGKGCGVLVRGWHNTDERVYIDVEYDERSGIEVFPGSWSQHPMNMHVPGVSDFYDRYVFSQSFRAKRNAPPGATPVTITVRQAGAGRVVLRLLVSVLEEGLIPGRGPGIRPPAEVVTGSGGEYCVWRYKSFGDRPECFNFVRAACDNPRYAAPRYELVGSGMTWSESGARMAQLGSYHEDAYGCHAWPDQGDEPFVVDPRAPGDLTAELDCGDSFELAPGDFLGKRCGIIVRGWQVTDEHVFVDVEYDKRSGIEVFPGELSQHPMNMHNPGISEYYDRYVFSQSFRAKQNAPPGVTPVTITVRQAGAGRVVLRLLVSVLEEGLIPGRGPGIRPPADVVTGSGGEYCVWRYKSFGDRPECFNFVRAACDTPRYAAPRYELVGSDMTWREAGVRMAQLGSYHEDAYGCHAWPDPDEVVIPDFRGRPPEDAKEWIEKNNLTVVFLPGTPAMTPGLSGTVESQDPEPGKVMVRGGTVTLAIHTEYVGIDDAPGAPVLKLVKIEGPAGEYTRSGMKIDSIEGSSGFSLHKRKEWTGRYRNRDDTQRWTPDLWNTELASLVVSSFPLEIVMGEPFSLEAELKMRHGYSAFHECHDPPTQTDGVKKYYIDAEVGPMGIRSKAVSLSALQNHCDRNKVCDEQYGISGDGWIIGEPCRTGITEKEEQISLVSRFIPSGDTPGTVLEKGKTRVYSYRLEHGTEDTALRAEGDLFKDSLSLQGEYSSWEELIITVRLEQRHPTSATHPEPLGFRLYYRPVALGPIAVAEYDHPEDFRRPPRNEPWPGYEEAIAETITDRDPDVHTWDDPQSIGPVNPRVAPLIRKWISAARPPENAVEGNNVRYSGKGNIIGTVAGGVIESRHETGEVDPVFLWTNRRSLDSVDHCTMEEFVVARLKNESIGHCAGRYGAVKDLKGLRLADARAAVSAAGFAYSLAPGSPAQTPDQDGTIELQRPGPEQYLKKGESLTLLVHAPYVPPGVALPDFTGTPLGEARQWLEERRLITSLMPGTPASTAALSGTVEKQAPAPGVTVEAGSTVTLTIHANHVELRVVPGVAGMSLTEARQALEGEDLVLTPTLLGPAPSPEQAGRIAAQRPGAGSQAAAGSAVAIDIYGDYAPPRAGVPDLRGMTLSQAQSALQGAGFEVEPKLIGPAPSPEQAGRIAGQSPGAGSQAAAGSAVAIDIYGDYAPPRAGVPDLRGMTLSQAQSALQGAGFGVEPKLIGPAPSAEQAQKVNAQSPAPGATAAPGTVVRIDLWGDYAVARVYRPQIYRHDLTGSYNRGEIIVTLENGRFVGRNYSRFLNNESQRRKGYHTGMIWFEVSARPDIEETIRCRGDMFRPTVYAGKILTSINDRAAYVNGYIWAWEDMWLDESNFKLRIARAFMKDGQSLKVGSSSWYRHDSRSERNSRIELMP